MTIKTLADLREDGQDHGRMVGITAASFPMLAFWAERDMAANAAALGVSQ